MLPPGRQPISTVRTTRLENQAPAVFRLHILFRHVADGLNSVVLPDLPEVIQPAVIQGTLEKSELLSKQFALGALARVRGIDEYDV